MIKYAEIGVKGKNRYIFEDRLCEQIRYALERCEGEFEVKKGRCDTLISENRVHVMYSGNEGKRAGGLALKLSLVMRRVADAQGI